MLGMGIRLAIELRLVGKDARGSAAHRTGEGRPGAVPLFPIVSGLPSRTSLHHPATDAAAVDRRCPNTTRSSAGNVAFAGYWSARGARVGEGPEAEPAGEGDRLPRAGLHGRNGRHPILRADRRGRGSRDRGAPRLDPNALVRLAYLAQRPRVSLSIPHRHFYLQTK